MQNIKITLILFIDLLYIIEIIIKKLNYLNSFIIFNNSLEEWISITV